MPGISERLAAVSTFGYSLGNGAGRLLLLCPFITKLCRSCEFRQMNDSVALLTGTTSASCTEVSDAPVAGPFAP